MFRCVKYVNDLDWYIIEICLLLRNSRGCCRFYGGRGLTPRIPSSAWQVSQELTKQRRFSVFTTLQTSTGNIPKDSEAEFCSSNIQKALKLCHIYSSIGLNAQSCAIGQRHYHEAVFRLGDLCRRLDREVVLSVLWLLRQLSTIHNHQSQRKKYKIFSLS